MSAFLIIGFFSLTDGRDVGVPKKLAGRDITSHYHYYVSSMKSQSDDATIAVEIRVFASRISFIHPQNTVAFIIARAAFDCDSRQLLLEASHVLPVIGDPSTPGYDNTYPAMSPIVIALGLCCSLPRSIPHPDDTFSVSVSDYVRDHNPKSQLICVASDSQLPPTAAVVQVIGFTDVRPTTHPIIIDVFHMLRGVLPIPSSSSSKKRVQNDDTECTDENSTSTPPASDKYPSSLIILGFFEITQLHQPTTTNVFYTTSIQCIDGTRLAAEIKIPGIQSHPFENDTVVFLIAYMAIPDNLPVVLESIYVSPVPGDPSQQGYQDAIPDIPNPFVVLLGTVTSTPAVAQGYERQFAVTTSAPVRDTCLTTCVRCSFDSNTNRWKNTRTPTLNSSVQVIGFCQSSDNNLTINIQGVVYAPFPTELPTVDLGDGTTNRKRKRFEALPTTSDHRCEPTAAKKKEAHMSSTSGTKPPVKIRVPPPQKDKMKANA